MASAAINSTSSVLMGEITLGGFKGALGLDQLDWGSAGKIWECWKLEPCCGKPCDPAGALYCLVCWWPCGWCASVKLYASSLDQQCSIFPHCLCITCCPWFSIPCLRYNIRKKNNVSGNILGDLVCTVCCPWFAFCTQLRAVEKKDWDLMPFVAPLPMAPETKFINVGPALAGLQTLISPGGGGGGQSMSPRPCDNDADL